MGFKIQEKTNYRRLEVEFPSVPVIMITRSFIKFSNAALKFMGLNKNRYEIVFSESDGKFYVSEVTMNKVMGYNIKFFGPTGRLSHNAVRSFDIDWGIYQLMDPVYDKENKLDWFELKFIDELRK